MRTTQRNTITIISLVIACVLAFVITGCQPPDQTARDTIATFSGVVAQAQQEYLTSCSGNPTQSACTTINKAVHAQNAAITSLETYCQFALNAPLPPVGTKCNPVKSAGDGLKAAINNLNQLMGEVKGLIPTKPTTLYHQPRHGPNPVQPVPWNADLSSGAIALALLALKQLLSNLKLGKYGDIASEAIDAVEGGITELEQYQGTEVTMEQLEGMRLHLLWPDPAPAVSSGDQQSGSSKQPLP